MIAKRSVWLALVSLALLVVGGIALGSYRCTSDCDDYCDYSNEYGTCNCFHDSSLPCCDGSGGGNSNCETWCNCVMFQGQFGKYCSCFNGS